jgi:hypothetical protein
LFVVGAVESDLGGIALASAMRGYLFVALVLLVSVLSAWGQSQSYANTRSPHGPLNIPCQNCHTLSGWKPIRSVPEFDHNQTRYPLRGMHQGVACTQCHVKPVFTNVGKQCADCHADIHKRQFGANCEQCHSVKGWQVSVQQINQHQNRFPLLGAHAALDCTSCHKGAATGQFIGLSTQCYSCHAKEYQTTTGPNHVTAGFPTTCEQCHGLNTWSGAKFDHLKITGFALTGAHISLDCTACHVGGKFAGTPATCVGCHLPDFQKTTNPNHVQAGFPQTCQSCHTTAAWQPATFDHNTFTKFPLTGTHATVACTQCHVNGQFAGTPADCASCHMKDFQGTTNPNHAQAGIPTTCATCHNTTSWANATFDHSKTGFPLTGVHVTTPCTQCHVNGNFNLTVTTCVSCHLKDYQGTTNPNHVQAGLPQTCESCHTTASWTNATFDHAKTGFPLTGAHVPLQCSQCHINGNYNLTNTTCVSCHLKDYQGTTDPNHVQAGMPQTCETCHSTASWANATFNHSTTGFPLTGAHVPLQCSQCHINGNYNLTDTTCVSCHLKDYQGTTDPNHVQAALPQTCQSCHSTTSWGSATFNHATTGFALTGAHVPLPCAQCHVNGNYTLSSGACSTCHIKDYQTTTDPNHVQAGFPQTCDSCHTTVTWANATFNHASTGFTLTGAHLPLQCSQCHVNGNYSLNSTACATCHLNDFNGTTNPNHVQSGFPQQCDVCHNTTAWIPSSFNHNNTPFPLTGKHTTVACASCHVNNNYTSVPTDCFSCHKTDYQTTTNPNHTAAGFPTTCQTCHTTTAWTGATFNHTWFPTNHGNAGGVCSACHTNASDYSVFSCTICHGKTQTDSNHRGVNGYVYSSPSCYQCHRNGRAGG